MNMEDKLKKQYNGWKAAFWVLVIVLIGSLLTVVHLASAPVKTPAETTAPNGNRPRQVFGGQRAIRDELHSG